MRVVPSWRRLAGAAVLCIAASLAPGSVSGQEVRDMSPADSAAVLLQTARDFEARGRGDVADALYRYIVEHFPGSPGAAAARLRLTGVRTGTRESGAVELEVWGITFGLWLGVAVPGALGADGSEPYGVGLLLGGPAGFLSGRAVARAKRITVGQARAITLGGTWGTRQGYGWREIFDWGVQEVCTSLPDGGATFCSSEDASEENFTAMVLGGLSGVALGTVLSDRDISAGTATAANFGALWGTWIGAAAGVLMDLEGDDLLAASLVGGNAGLVSMALKAPAWRVTRSRARVVSIAGVIGG